MTLTRSITVALVGAMLAGCGLFHSSSPPPAVEPRRLHITLVGGSQLNLGPSGRANPIQTCIYVVRSAGWAPLGDPGDTKCAGARDDAVAASSRQVIAPNQLLQFTLDPNTQDELWLLVDADYAQRPAHYAPLRMRVEGSGLTHYAIWLDGNGIFDALRPGPVPVAAIAAAGTVAIAAGAAAISAHAAPAIAAAATTTPAAALAAPSPIAPTRAALPLRASPLRTPSLPIGKSPLPVRPASLISPITPIPQPLTNTQPLATPGVESIAIGPSAAVTHVMPNPVAQPSQPRQLASQATTSQAAPASTVYAPNPASTVRGNRAPPAIDNTTATGSNKPPSADFVIGQPGGSNQDSKPNRRHRSKKKRKSP